MRSVKAGAKFIKRTVIHGHDNVPRSGQLDRGVAKSLALWMSDTPSSSMKVHTNWNVFLALVCCGFKDPHGDFQPGLVLGCHRRVVRSDARGSVESGIHRVLVR